MRKNTYHILGCILAIVAFLMWLLKRLPNDTEIAAADSRIETTQDSTSNQNSSNAVNPKARLEREEQTRLIVEIANVPIKFYGKVVDPEGKPLSNVTVKYRVQRAELSYDVGNSIVGTVTTGTEGLFGITNERGTSIGLESFQKDGYQLMQNQQTSFGYSGTPVAHRPSHDSPRVYVMAANNAAIDVTTASQKIRLPWDGKAIRIDLDSGIPSPSGKLFLTASRTATTGRFGWNLTLLLDGGGLKEAEPGTVFIAPDKGYLPVRQCGCAPDVKPAWYNCDVNVYYKIGGKYGRLKLEIYADGGPKDMRIHLENFVNNSGGRNTEGRQ